MIRRAVFAWLEARHNTDPMDVTFSHVNLPPRSCWACRAINLLDRIGFWRGIA